MNTKSARNMKTWLCHDCLVARGREPVGDTWGARCRGCRRLTRCYQIPLSARLFHPGAGT